MPIFLYSYSYSCKVLNYNYRVEVLILLLENIFLYSYSWKSTPQQVWPGLLPPHYQHLLTTNTSSLQQCSQASTFPLHTTIPVCQQPVVNRWTPSAFFVILFKYFLSEFAQSHFLWLAGFVSFYSWRHRLKLGLEVGNLYLLWKKQHYYAFEADQQFTNNFPNYF